MLKISALGKSISLSPNLLIFWLIRRPPEGSTPAERLCTSFNVGLQPLPFLRPIAFSSFFLPRDTDAIRIYSHRASQDGLGARTGNKCLQDLDHQTEFHKMKALTLKLETMNGKLYEDNANLLRVFAEQNERLRLLTAQAGKIQYVSDLEEQVRSLNEENRELQRKNHELLVIQASQGATNSAGNRYEQLVRDFRELVGRHHVTMGEVVMLREECARLRGLNVPMNIQPILPPMASSSSSLNGAIAPFFSDKRTSKSNQPSSPLSSVSSGFRPDHLPADAASSAMHNVLSGDDQRDVKGNQASTHSSPAREINEELRHAPLRDALPPSNDEVTPPKHDEESHHLWDESRLYDGSQMLGDADIVLHNPPGQGQDMADEDEDGCDDVMDIGDDGLVSLDYCIAYIFEEENHAGERFCRLCL
jgi:hypothetical protein